MRDLSVPHCTRLPVISQERSRNVILLVANYAPDGQRSMSRYAHLLQSALELSGKAVKVWAPPVLFGRLAKSSTRGFKWIAYIDKLLVAPLALLFAQLGAARVHICDHSNAYYAFVVWARRCTATCHDVIAIQAAHGLVPGWAVGRSGRALQGLISAGLGAVDQVLCVSEHTRQHLLELRLTGRDKTVVAPNPLAPAFSQPGGTASAALKALRSRIGPRYFIHVGSDLPRKNRQVLLEIFAQLAARPAYADAALLLVGPPPNEQQWRLLEASGLGQRVHQVGFLTDADLAAAYRDAIALIFPSLQEGFGWPVAEAQMCGCPVFASNLPPMTEVGGTAACYFDPARPAQAAELIAHASLDVMRAEGQLNAQRYTLANLAQVFCA